MRETIDRASRRFRGIPRAARRAAATAVMLFATLASASGQAPPPDRARTLGAIEAYHGVRQKFTRSTGPLADYAGFYSRGYRCEYNEKTAARPPGVWEKTQYALWFDDKYLYGMTLDASPAVFQFAYRPAPNKMGWPIYQMTRVDTLGAAAGIDATEWGLLAFDGAHSTDGATIGLRIPPEFLTTPDVNAIGYMTTCGQGSDGMDPFLDQSNPIYFSLQFLQKRLAALPTP